MEGDGRQCRYVMYERGGHTSPGCDGVVWVPRVLGLVRSRTPVEVEEEIRLGGNLAPRHQRGTVGREGGDGIIEACRGWVYLRCVSAKNYPASDTAQLRPDTGDVESASPASCVS